MKYALIFSLIFVLVSCSNEPVLEDTLVVRNGLVFEVNEQQPFSGTSVSYYPNGQIKEKINYIDGDLGLFHESYYDNGQIQFIYTYDKEGKRKDGKFFSYFRNGSVEFESIFKDGKRHGTQTSYWISMGGNGGPKTITQFEEGNLTELSEFDRSGTLLLKEIYEGGIYGNKTILFDLIAEQKKKELAEKERISVENEIKRKKGQQDWRTAVNDFINKNKIELLAYSFEVFSDNQKTRVEIMTTCRGPDIVMGDVPWRGNLIVKYKDNRKDFVIKNDGGRGNKCGDFAFVEIGKEEFEDYLSNIDNISFEINMAPDVSCFFMSKNKDNPYDVLCPSNYPDLGEDIFLDDPITLYAKFNIDSCGELPTRWGSEYTETLYWDSKAINYSENIFEECK